MERTTADRINHLAQGRTDKRVLNSEDVIVVQVTNTSHVLAQKSPTTIIYEALTPSLVGRDALWLLRGKFDFVGLDNIAYTWE